MGNERYPEVERKYTYSGPRKLGGGYDDKKPEMKARGFHLVLSMLMFKSRWGLLLNQKNKFPVNSQPAVKGECCGAGLGGARKES